MKTNEAPERLYVHINILGDVSAYKEDWCRPPHCVEYIRKDAFIEKVCEWINEHTSLSEKLVIENFRKYMEGE